MPVVGDAGSTVPRRQLGRRLRQSREQARLTVRAAAEALEWSTPKLWRIEGGMVGMRALDVEAMCRVYGAPADLTAELMRLARRTRARGWWREHGDAVPGWFELYVGLETAACRLRSYAPDVVPDLLRTPAYAAEVIRATEPGTPEERVDRAVGVLRHRQRALTRTDPAPPVLEVVLDEPALHRPLRDPAATREQLRHLGAVAARDNVSVRVLPLAAGLHPGVACGGGFTVLDFPADERPAEPSTVYRQHLTGGCYLDKPTELTAYETLWASVRAAALTEAATRELIAGLLDGR
jgi:transcriptional regulator with XRE-family HTH domain